MSQAAPKPNVVGYEVEGDVAVVTLTNPPVNALSAAVRQGLNAALDRAIADPQVKGIVITGAGKLFCAGADITEFGKTPQSPSLPDVLARIETLRKPVVAAVNGPALGGGCELTLACHGRTGGPKTSFSLPEIRLGLIPGAGGTQRMPRVITQEEAFKFMLSGDSMSAREALAKGLLDEVTEDALTAAKALVLKYAAAGHWPITGERPVLGGAGFEAEVESARKKAGMLLNTHALIRAVTSAGTLTLAEGLAVEREEFMKLVGSDQSRALRHVFFAERVPRVPGLAAGVTARPVAQVAVIGAGTMGGGIAMSFANAGIPVKVIETNADPLHNGLARVKANYETSVKRGSMTQAAMDAAMALIQGHVGLAAVADADLVVEAAFEEMSVKNEIFSALGKLAKPGAVLATNTSYLNVDEIAAASGRPADVLGMHFFSPANVMRLLEVVRGAQTAPDALQTGIAIGKKIGKLPVVSGVCFGFIGNRMLSTRMRAAETLLLSGNSPSEIDAAITEFGFRMGQFAMADLAGIDIGWRIRKAFGGFAPVADRLANMGRFGQKTGRGFYLYPEGARKGVADPEVLEIAREEAKARGVAQSSLSRQEIIERLFYPMVNEGARILDEGIAYCPSDIDLTWINGYGWPSWTGGPMFWADTVGLDKIATALEAQAKALGATELQPSALLRRLASEGKTFSSLTEGKKA